MLDNVFDMIPLQTLTGWDHPIVVHPLEISTFNVV